MAKGTRGGKRGTSARSIIDQYSIDNIGRNQASIVEFYKQLDLDGSVNIYNADEIEADSKAMRLATELSEQLVNDMYFENGAMKQDYTTMKDIIGRKTYTISSKDRSNIADFNDYRKSSAVKIGRNGQSIDSLYEELSSAMPHQFSKSITNVGDRLMKINDIYKKSRSYKEKLPKNIKKSLVQDLANNLITSYAMLNADDMLPF